MSSSRKRAILRSCSRAMNGRSTGSASIVASSHARNNARRYASCASAGRSVPASIAVTNPGCAAPLTRSRTVCQWHHSRKPPFPARQRASSAHTSDSAASGRSSAASASTQNSVANVVRAASNSRNRTASAEIAVASGAPAATASRPVDTSVATRSRTLASNTTSPVATRASRARSISTYATTPSRAAQSAPSTVKRAPNARAAGSVRSASVSRRNASMASKSASIVSSSGCPEAKCGRSSPWTARSLNQRTTGNASRAAVSFARHDAGSAVRNASRQRARSALASASRSRPRAIAASHCGFSSAKPGSVTISCAGPHVAATVVASSASARAWLRDSDVGPLGDIHPIAASHGASAACSARMLASSASAAASRRCGNVDAHAVQRSPVSGWPCGDPAASIAAGSGSSAAAAASSVAASIISGASNRSGSSGALDNASACARAV